MIFSQNQNRHVFVNKTEAKTSLENVTAAGDVFVGGPSSHSEMYFNYMTPGGMIRSDIVKKDNILWATATDAADMAYNLKRAVVHVNSAALDENGKPFVGEDYILHIKVKQFVGAAEESTYHKFGAVHVTTGMNLKNFYLKMAKSLAVNFSRDINKFFRFGVLKTDASHTSESDATVAWVDANTDITNLTTFPDTTYSTGTPTGHVYFGIVVQELSQSDWKLGVTPQRGVNFSVYTSSVLDGNSDPVIWSDSTSSSDITWSTSGSVVNSHVIADLEYDAMVERGDVYKNVGWPYVMNTEYLVVPSDTYGYDTLDIHFYFVDSKEGAQKSEKTITFVCPKGTGDDTHDVINALIGKINTQLGITLVSTLS